MGLYFNEAALIDEGAIITRFVMIIVLLQISQLVYGGCLRAGGDVRYTLIAGIISVTIIRTSVTVILVNIFNLGLYGIWIGILSDQFSRFILLRHPMAGAARLLAKNVSASVVNAGDGFNENPGQSLLDLMTIKEQKGDFKGLRVAIIGDLIHSRVCKSNIWALTKLGASVCVSGPPTLLPSDIEKFGVDVYYDAKKAVAGADVILTSRMKNETKNKNLVPSLTEYKHFFRVDENLLHYAKPDTIIMHPGPIQRGIEISADVIDSKRCIINDQIANSVAVRMAMLYILSQIGGGLK